MRWLGQAAAAFALFFVSFTLPLGFLVLTTEWYDFNCQFHTRCERFGKAELMAHAEQLPRYFLHLAELEGRWSLTERLHMADVRRIYDSVALLALIAIAVCGLVLKKRPEWFGRVALWNVFIILGLLAILPVFGYFWKHIFHAVLFTNEYWKTSRADVSWYLMPRVYFRNAFILMVAAAALINLTVYFAWRLWPAKKQTP